MEQENTLLSKFGMLSIDPIDEPNEMRKMILKIGIKNHKQLDVVFERKGIPDHQREAAMISFCLKVRKKTFFFCLVLSC